MINGQSSEFVDFLKGINLVGDAISFHNLRELSCGEARIVAERLLSLVKQQNMILQLRDESDSLRDLLEPTAKKLTGN